MKKNIIKVLSILLSLVLLFTALPFGVFAKSEQDISENDATVSVNADNDFSKIVMQKIENEEAEQGLFGVTEIEIKNKSADVQFVAPDNSKLIVAVYSERGQMLGYGMAEVDSAMTECSVSLSEVNFPKYFIIKGFLVDNNNFAICKEYVDRTNTADFERFLELSADDFDEEYVLNFDDNPKNNFAVLKQDIVMAESSNGKNVLSSYDEKTDTYIFDNASSDLKGLKSGDTFYLKTGDGNADYIIVTVKSISVSNNKTTIVSNEETVEEVFDFIKINSSSGLSEEDIENAELGSALTLVNDGIKTCDINQDSHFGDSLGTEVNYKAFDEDGVEVTVKGGLTFSFSAHVKVYYDSKWGDDYFEYEFSHEEKMEINVTVTGKVAVDKEKVKIGFDDIPITGTPITVSVNVFPVLEFSGSATFEVTCTSEFIQTYNPYDGEKRVQNKDKDWDSDIAKKFEIKIGFGISVEAKAVKILSVEVSASVYLNIGGEVDDMLQCLVDKYHYCHQCVEGDIKIQIDIELTVSVKITKKLTWDLLKAQIPTISVKLCDFYISTIYGIKTVGFTKCPNKLHKVTFNVYYYDENNIEQIPIVNATLDLIDGKTDSDGDGKLDSTVATTDDEGNAYGYYRVGGYKADLTAKDYVDRDVHFYVDGAVKIPVEMDKNNPDPEPGDDPSTPGGDDWFDDETGNVKWKYDGSTKTLTIYGTGKMDDYSTFGVSPWDAHKEDIENIVVESGVTSLGDYAFAQCTNLEKVTIAGTVTDIGMASFYQCDALKSLTLPNSVKVVDDYAFYGCYSMKTLNLGNVERIGAYAFAQCTALENVTVPMATTNIGDSAFAWCQGLKTITFYNKNCNIYDSANTIWQNTKISAPVGSKAESYANKYGRTFSSIMVAGVVDTTEVCDTYIINVSSCVAGNDYILLNVTGYGAGFELSTTNLEYIDQLTADSNGVVNTSFIPRRDVAGSTTLLIGDFGNGIEVKTVTPKYLSVDITIVNNPGSKTINYGEGIRLYATATDADEYTIKWYVDGEEYCTGDTLECRSLHDDIEVTVKLVDANGNPVVKDGSEISENETINVKDGFFQKLAAFFKFTLFRQVVIKTN